jgi:hypothetical protein
MTRYAFEVKKLPWMIQPVFAGLQIMISAGPASPDWIIQSDSEQ